MFWAIDGVTDGDEIRIDAFVDGAFSIDQNSMVGKDDKGELVMIGFEFDDGVGVGLRMEGLVDKKIGLIWVLFFHKYNFFSKKWWEFYAICKINSPNVCFRIVNNFSSIIFIYELTSQN